MLKERFIQQILTNPPGQRVEEVASTIHETNRLSDPYIYLVKDQRLVAPTGLIIGDIVKKDSYLGKTEYTAFKQIEDWVSRESSGLSVWFSPPYPGTYPVSKIIISEMSTNGKVKLLFNRAVVLDIDAEALITLANQLTEGEKFIQDSELLRAHPFFPSAEKFIEWFELLKLYTSQTRSIEDDIDIVKKHKAYQFFTKTIAVAGPNTLYADLYQKAEESGLIGPMTGSCPSTTTFTSFEQMFNNSLKINKTHTLDCVCPYCKQRVKASISNGEIQCPNCLQTAPYRC